MVGFPNRADRLINKATVLWLPVLLTMLFALPLLGASAAKKQSAHAQFDKAEAARQTLAAKPLAERKLADYQAILKLYRNVPILAPTIRQASESIYQAAQLNQEMAQRFPRDAAKYRADARSLYQTLLKQYPQTRYRKQSN